MLRSLAVPRSTRTLVAALLGASLGWAALYALNEVLWDALFVSVLGLDLDERIPGAVHFFLYDTSKIFLLLTGMIFLIGMLRTTLRPERVRQFLDGKPLWLSLVLAALFGAITPFCSCSSIPLFIGFVGAGIPLAVTLTFLIASPLVNEVAVVLLADTFGAANTVAYVAAGLTAAIVIGFIFSRLSLDHLVADFVFATPVAVLQADGRRPTLHERVEAALEETREIVGRVWKWILIGVGVGAFIHGWVPTEFFATYAGPDNPFAVLLATLAGVPLYANAAGVIPIAEALWSKGMALGTVMSFMMATVALSLPEFILLKQVLKPKLLALFFGSVAVAIVVIGVLFNLAT
ncbi:Putative two-component membrane permease complex subunit SMU_747c [Tessaracoccus lapidicaptus]|nr:Putative two-component membrane permease complex subunit SMU_747c [Tessaracoccus lapidicaptus]